MFIRKSEISGKELFVMKNVDAGSLVLVTKAIAMERSIIMGGVQDLCEDAQLAMWKNFIDKVFEVVGKCHKTKGLVTRLSCGENEDELEVLDVGLFRPESLVGILDVNSLTEDVVSANVLRRGNDCYGVGLWLLPSFVNHSCVPNGKEVACWGLLGGSCFQGFESW
ncbi:hypothetical protein HKD37_20G055545 [Glycine soja]